jgi:N-sulfoglucosamine sulfohydrolase
MKIRFFLLLGAMIILTACGSADTETYEGYSDRPNILFAIADDASYPHMSAYGTGWVKTPAFDRVAREGLLFTRAYTPNAKCAPSRSCILTGRNSWQLEEAANHWPFFPEKFKTYPEVLAENGYHVGFTGKGWAPGKAGERDGQPRQLTGTPFQERKMTPPAEHISNTDYAANFADFLDARPEGEPFCFWYGATEPHRRYEFGAGIGKGGKSLDDIDEVPPYWPDTDTVRTDMLDYAFEIEYFDRHLQQMLLLLEAEGELDNTIVVVTADNGMPFPRAKGQAYEISNHLPLAIRWPGDIRNPGRTTDAYVSFIDFAPTFLEIAGVPLSECGMQPVTGKSLMDIFSNEKEGTVLPGRDRVLVGKERHDVGRPNDVGYPIRGIIKDNYLYVVNFEPERWPSGNPETGYLNTDGSPTKTQILQMRRRGTNDRFWEQSFGKRPAEELYRLDLDPTCVHNLAGNPEYQAIRNTMWEKLFDELRAQGDPRMTGSGAVFDHYSYADSSSVHFYERYLQGDSLNAGWVNPSDFEEAPVTVGE